MSMTQKAVAKHTAGINSQNMLVSRTIFVVVEIQLAVYMKTRISVMRCIGSSLLLQVRIFPGTNVFPLDQYHGQPGDLGKCVEESNALDSFLIPHLESIASLSKIEHRRACLNACKEEGFLTAAVQVMHLYHPSPFTCSNYQKIIKISLPMQTSAMHRYD